MEKVQRILVVDDSPDNRDIVSCILRGEGYTVEEAGNYHEALGYVWTNQIDLILTDCEMPPGPGGLQLLLAVRRQLHMSVPVICMSGNTKYESLSQIAGAQHFLMKPFGSDLLISCVEEVLSPDLHSEANAS